VRILNYSGHRACNIGFLKALNFLWSLPARLVIQAAKNLTADRQALYFLCGYIYRKARKENYARLND